MYKTPVLQPIERISVRYEYDKFNTVITPKQSPKIKFLASPQLDYASPQLDYNPQYNQIHDTISNNNLALKIAEAYEKIDYRPISSTGFRGFSSLSSHKNKIAETFGSKQVSMVFDKLTQPTVKTEPVVIQEQLKFSTPLINPFLKSTDTSSNYTPSPAREKGSNKGRGMLFKKLNKVRQEALLEKAKESSFKTPAFTKRKGTGTMPGNFSNKKEDEE